MKKGTNIWTLFLNSFTKCALLLSLVLLFSVIISSFSGFSVHASSTYDNNMQLTASLPLGNDTVSPYGISECSIENHATDWYTIAHTALTTSGYHGSGDASAYDSSLTTGVTSGRYAVTSYHNRFTVSGTLYENDMIFVSWTENDSLYLQWEDGYTVARGDSTFKSIEIMTKAYQSGGSDCSPFVQLSGDGSTSSEMVSTVPPASGNSVYAKSYLIYTDHPNYPDGYEGIYASPIPPLSYIPDLTIANGTDHDIIITDNRFFTFDTPEFLCQSETTPIVHYEVWQGGDPDTDELIESGVFSPTVQLHVTMPDDTSENNLVAWYSCGDSDYSFIGSTHIHFYYDNSDSPSNNSDETPNLLIVTATGYHLVVQDTNFNTFDDPPFTCDSGLTPVMHYELWQGGNPDTDVMIDTGIISPTVQYEHNLPNIAEHYSMVAWYSCGDSPELQFLDSAHMSFEMNEFGGLVQTCDSDLSGWYCSIGQSLSFGIISTSLNGLIGVLMNLQEIDPSYCNTNWIATVHFTDTIVPVQDMPQSMCDNAETLYLTSGSPFHIVQFWLNMLLRGGAIMFLMLGILSLLGVNVKIPTSITGHSDDALPPAGYASGQGDGFGSRRKYIPGGKR